MTQFFEVRYEVHNNPALSWIKTLSLYEILNLVDAQGVCIYLPQCLKWWAVEDHFPENEFAAEYGPDPAIPTPKRKFLAKAL